jgi:hypothetical protein
VVFGLVFGLTRTTVDSIDQIHDGRAWAGGVFNPNKMAVTLSATQTYNNGTPLTAQIVAFDTDAFPTSKPGPSLDPVGQELFPEIDIMLPFNTGDLVDLRLWTDFLGSKNIISVNASTGGLVFNVWSMLAVSL